MCSPSQVETAITGIEGIAPRYMLVVDRVRNLDTLEVQVELLPELVSDEVRKIEEPAHGCRRRSNRFWAWADRAPDDTQFHRAQRRQEQALSSTKRKLAD